MAAISVVIPTYNSRTLNRAIYSVTAQTLLPCEIVIVDDASKEPINLCDLECIYPAIKFKLIVNDVNMGASFSRNIGIKNSTGEYIAFLDSDDIWHQNKLEIQYRHMIESKSSISGTYYLPNASNSEEEFINSKPSFDIRCKEVKPFHFVFGNPFFTPTVMVRRKDFFGFDNTLRRVDDYKAWYITVTFHAGSLILFPLAAGYKSPIGESGLTGSMHEMHKAYIWVLKSLRHDHFMSFTYYLFASLLEYIKYPMRIVLQKIDRIWAH